MEPRNHPRPGDLDDEELERDIARFERMSEQEVDDELARMKVDAAPTVSHVLAIVKTKMTEWNRLRLHLTKK
jgi:hypothetical protein